MRLAIWSTTAPREKSTHVEMFQRQLEEVELAERIGIDQIWFFEHHLNPSAPVPSPNLLIAAAARTTHRIRFSSMVNILPFRHPLLVAEEAAMLDNLTNGRFDMGLGNTGYKSHFRVDQTTLHNFTASRSLAGSALSLIYHRTKPLKNALKKYVPQLR